MVTPPVSVFMRRISTAISLCFFIASGALTRLHGQTIVVKPYLQDATPQKITIMWEADNVGNGYVDYGLTPFNLNSLANSFSIAGNGSSRIHAAEITGLEANAKYYYRVRMASGAVSKVYFFITPPLKSSDQKVNFVAVSDMQRDGSNPNVYKTLVENGIIPVCDTALQFGVPDLRGIIIPGDLVQTGGIYSSWKTDFFDLADSLTPYVPIYPVPGNHEYYSNGLPNFLKYFTLPLNGSAGNPEEWWYKDISNVRIIGLNSNSPAAQLTTQLDWIQAVLQEAGSDADIDFVFAQLHHPYKSELWVPGELDFTGEVIKKLENFSATYGKPSLHFFGHTHAYSRGASRDHTHLWVNVATAGGAIDNWGEFPNADYEEFVISEDEYGFVLMEVEAGPDPSFRLRRFSRGDQNVVKNNPMTDEIKIRRYEYGPTIPKGLYPVSDSVQLSCVLLKASVFQDPDNTHQASHWQVTKNCDFNAPDVINRWVQAENWYNEVNTQAGDDLTDEMISGLSPGQPYCWRVRYRDNYLQWSEWSAPLTFYTKNATQNNNTNLLSNTGAESGISDWTGQIESLTNNECNSVPVYQGLRFFAVGGVCSNEQATGIATQTADVSALSGSIDAGHYFAYFSAFMRAYSTNNDKPEMYLEFLDTNNGILSTTPTISNATPAWLEKSLVQQIPPGTRYIRAVLKGSRLAGTDNDSYFDEIRLTVFDNVCPTCIGSATAGATDTDGDGFCDGFDCAPENAQIFPGNVETCDGLDNNCDGLTDSGAVAVWTGNGDGSFWNNGANWSQQFPPLPCQHVVISGNQAVTFKGKAHIKSLEIEAGSDLNIYPEAEMIINGSHPASQSAANIKGSCTNQGKLLIKNSAYSGLNIEGTVSNTTGALIRISQVNLNDIRILPTGLLVNNSVVEIKD